MDTLAATDIPLPAIEAERARASLEAIVEFAPAAIFTLNPRGLVETWNAEAERIFQRSEDDAIGAAFASLFPRRTPSLARIDAKILDGEKVELAPFTIRRKDEEPVELEIRASPISSREGASGTVLIVTDVTRRNQSERDLKALNEELERRVAERTAELVAVNRELEAFCFSISHDLRAPLRAIDGFSRAVLQDNEDVLSPVSRNHLSRVRNATRRMSELIDSLLSLSRLTRVEIRREWVDLSALAAEVASDLEASAPEQWVWFEIQPDLRSYGDPRLLALLLENLLGNAFKFSAQNEEATVRFGFQEGEFFVSDNGAGFDMAYVHRLFMPFERLHSANEYPGHGIGLATAHRIVTRHGGSIRAQGVVGQGAEFRFTLPAGPSVC